MLKYTYDKNNWPDFVTGNNIDWCLTNGLGSYSSGTLIGGLSRSHQGLLVASLHSPAQRFVIMEQMCEWVKAGGNTYDLETSVKMVDGKLQYRNGQDYLTSVSYDGTMTFHYECGSTMASPASPTDSGGAIATIIENSSDADADSESTLELVPEFELTKYVALKRGENTLAIGYDFVNNTDTEAKVVLTPWFNFRKENTITYPGVPKYDKLRTGDTLSLVPRSNPYVRVDLSISGGTYYDCPTPVDAGSQLIHEVESGLDGLCAHFSPYDISVSVPAHSKSSYSVLCNVVISDVIQGMALLQQASDCFINNRSAHRIVNECRKYYAELINNSGYDDAFINKLILSADSFIADRASTGTSTILSRMPRSVDKAPDSLIAFTGLTLCTKRYDDAGQILFTFAKHIEKGLTPSSFNHASDEPTYESADASLWLILDVYKYLKYLRNDPKVSQEYMRSAASYIYNNIYPLLAGIIDAYENGTDLAIKMLPNGLLSVGDVSTNATWMNCVIDGTPVTPRYGCPVEINALWYNALCVMETLGKVCHVDVTHYKQLSDKIKNVFRKIYWNADRNCLYDVVLYDEATGEFTPADNSIRPNQIYAVSLPFSLLIAKEERAIVDTVGRKLYVGAAVKSLSSDSHGYIGKYQGTPDERRRAAHNGTAWSFLLGAYLSAFRKTYGNSKDGKARLRTMYSVIEEHMEHAGCIGGISAVYGGDTPFICDGAFTFNHASAVGEILRSYIEDVIMPSIK